GGKTWTNVSKNIPGLPAWGTIHNIDASNFDAGTCYLSVDAHHVNDFGSYVFKTTDYGKTWTRLKIELPASNSNFVNQIKEDPAKAGLLWLGTDKSLYFSPDDGKNWIHLKSNLPPVPIYGIEIQKNFRDLVIGTYGRGIYILDDITPIREFSEQVQNSNAHLFSLRPTYRFQDVNGIKTENSFVNGQNPPDGAAITYYLKEKSKDSVELLVYNSNNELIQKLKTKNQLGLQRVWWNLRLQEHTMPKLRTHPRGKEWVELDEKGERNLFIPDLDIGPGLTPPMVPPGNYTVVLKAHGKEFKQSVSVLKDPNTMSTPESMQRQYTLGVKLFTSIKTSLQLIDDMEKMRTVLLAKKGDKKAAALEEKIYQLEAILFDINQTGARWDIFRSGAQVLERFLALGKESQIFSADAPPTDQQGEVYEITLKRMEEVQSQFELIRKNPEIKQIEKKK
ncbi:MAG: glycosyl hydrolase, partial [Cyclobacteriaceae bacterium]|nr:glycosyl hydrolase [Cyclobacteriaceae bacterium]